MTQRNTFVHSPSAAYTRRAALLAFAFPLLAAESAARQKLNRIEQGRVRPGWITFSLKELNLLAAEEIVKTGLEGVRDPVVELGHGSAIGSARVDFAKVRESATGEAPGGLGRAVLGGEKLVSVETTIRSGKGLCTMDPQRVSINGLDITGRLLDWLISNYLLPLYPTAKVGQPFEMGFRVDELDVTPARIRLKIV